MSYINQIISTKSNLAYTIATVLYACIAFGLLSSVNIEIFTKHAADAESWIEPAKGFSEHGAFVRAHPRPVRLVPHHRTAGPGYSSSGGDVVRLSGDCFGSLSQAGISARPSV